jgi:hypothetical protein
VKKLKHILFVLVVCTSFSGDCFAQETGEKSIEPPSSSGSAENDAAEKPSKKPEQGIGYFIVSLAAVYNFNLSGVRDEKSSGELAPGALLFEMGANKNIGFETGIIFLEQQYQVANDKYYLQQNVKRLRVPLTVKIWFFDTIAISAGPYVAISASRINSYKVVRTVEDNSLTTPADNFVEFGFDAALTLNVPINHKSGVFVEGRYYAPYDKVELKKYNSFYLMGGVKYNW